MNHIVLVSDLNLDYFMVNVTSYLVAFFEHVVYISETSTYKFS